MKKKIILTLATVLVLMCAFVMVISATTTICVDEENTELFRFETSGSTTYPITSYSGTGFARYDSEGDALTWYWLKTTTLETGEKQYTGASAKTKTLVSDDGD